MNKYYRVKITNQGKVEYFYDSSLTGFSEKNFFIFSSEELAIGVMNSFKTLTSNFQSSMLFEVEPVEDEYFFQKFIELAKEIKAFGRCPCCGGDDIMFTSYYGGFYCNSCFLEVEKKFFDMIKND